MMTDPIADMLTRIRNALRAGQDKVDIPGSRLKLEIARVLKDEGYVQNYKRIEDNRQGMIRISLRKGPDSEDVIEGLTRVSKPGCRIYCGKSEIPKVRGGLGINILSTPKGVMTGKQAAREGIGGEILCNIW
jgi:small subunit ribosomal protein S8